MDLFEAMQAINVPAKERNKKSLKEEQNRIRFTKKKFDLIKLLNDKLDGGYYHTSYEAHPEDDGENFYIRVRYPYGGEMQKVYDRVAPILREFGAKRIKKEGSKYTENGYVRFFIPMSVQEKMRDEFEQKENKREQDYLTSINSADIKKYKPSPKVLQKLQDYKNRDSRINVGAMKDLNKALTYLWASIVLDMKDTRNLEWKAKELGADKATINAIYEFAN